MGLCGFRLSGEVLMFLYATIFTTNYMVLPQLLLKKICLRNNNFNASMCTNLADHPLQQEASKWFFYMLLSNHAPSLVIIMIWGPFSDLIGRRASAVFVSAVNASQALVYLLNSFFMKAHPGYLFLGSVLSSLYGEVQGVILLSYASIADVTAENQKSRTMRMTLVEAGLLISGLLTGMVSGQILGRLGFVFLFMFVIFLNILICVFALLFLPSAIKKKPVSNDERNPLMSSSPNHIISSVDANKNVSDQQKLKEIFNPCRLFKKSLGIMRRREYKYVLLPLLLALAFEIMAQLGENAVQVLYMKHDPFRFSSRMIGYNIAFQAILRGFGAILLTQVSYRSCMLNDHWLMIIGQISQAVAYFLVGLSRTALPVFLSHISSALMALTLAAIRSHATKLLSTEDPGAVLASMEAMDEMSELCGVTIALWLYRATESIYSGITYFVLSGFALVSLLFALLAWYMQKRLNRFYSSGH